MESARIPEPGQYVRVRRRHWQVLDVHPAATDRRRSIHHKVILDPVESHGVSEPTHVIWELEAHREVHDEILLPTPEGDTWDPLERFEAFLHALRWSSTSICGPLPLQAPFRAAVQIHEYQLEPVVRALEMPRVNLLIADFVGAGKTIEAGFVVQELIARQRARRILIVCPASLQRQWAEALEQKFALGFQIVDRDHVRLLRKEYGVHANPWTSHPRLITSMDFLKRSEPLGSFLQSVRRDRPSVLKDWDLLVVDEAHNVAPSGRGAYVRDSDRTAMMREILPHFEHRLFLTATPHNGFSESFTALLEMLDPQRFSRGPIVDREDFERQRDAVMVRRVKEEIEDEFGKQRFPRRVIGPPLAVTLDDTERELVTDLDAYSATLLSSSSPSGLSRLAVQFALTLLKKRLLSSPRAFAESIKVHQSHIREPGHGDAEVVEALEKRTKEDFDDDDEKARCEQEALAEASAFFEAPSAELERVARMLALGERLAEGPDTKASQLFAYIETHLRPRGRWGDERIVVFTEYRDTLDYLLGLIAQRGWTEATLTLLGGTPLAKREEIKAAFLAPPDEHPVRILLATDAASEGLDLQYHCRHLVHYEIPWNPNRMEQRNGRIDRHGQPAAEVFCRHFAYTNNEDQRFLDVIVEKVETQRDDLGAVSDIVAREVERAMLGLTREIRDDPQRLARQRAELRSELQSTEQRRALVRAKVEEARREMARARETWRLTPDAMRRVLHEAVRLEGGADGLAGLEPANDALSDNAWHLRAPPWPDCRSLVRNTDGRLVKLVFDGRQAWDDRGRMRKGVALIHLDHPLMRRALSAFRSRVWSGVEPGGQELARVSYKVVADEVASRVHLVAFWRLIATNSAGLKIHEELVATGGALRSGEIAWLGTTELEHLIRVDGTHPRIDEELGRRLRADYPSHRRLLEGRITEERKAHTKSLRAELTERGKKDARTVKECIDQRLAEVKKKLKELHGKRDSGQQEFAFVDEEEQWNEDLHWLERRLDALLVERTEEPKRVQSLYEVAESSVRALPVALLYFLPASTHGIVGTQYRSTGPITHEELYRLLGQLERCLREAIELAHPGDDWARFLSPERLAAVRDVQEHKRQSGRETPLLRCLYLADLSTITGKSETLRARLGLGESTKKAKERIKAFERIRNVVMHHDDLARSAEELAKLHAAREDLIDLLDGLETALRAWEER